jgi:hypothetical protein
MRLRTKRVLVIAALAGGLTPLAHAQSLTTLFAQNNNGSVGGAVYFDVTITNPIIINSIDTNTGTAGAIGATVYTIAGTYVGNTGNPAAWTERSTGTGTGAGVNNPTPISLATPITLNAGTYGVAIIAAAPAQPSFAHYYTNGTGSNQNYSNADLALSLGAASNTPWGALFSPRVWNGTIHYIPANPNAIGACCFTDGSCQFITLASCQSQSGSFRGENVTCAAANCPQPGACCMPDGTCNFVQQGACVGAGGVFNAGLTCAQANCPQPGACCFLNGTCAVLQPPACAAQGGVLSASPTCAAANCPTFEIVADRPGQYVDITATGTYYNLADDGTTDIVSSVGNAMLAPGTHRITNNGAISWGNLGATAFTNAALPSTALAGGNKALAPYWDDLYTYAGAPGGQGVYVQELNGNLYITWNVGHISVSNSSGTVQLQVFGSGPIMAQYIYQNVEYGTGFSNGESATIGVQGGTAGGANNFLQWSFNTANSVNNGRILSIVQQGGPAICYPNCDASTTAPILNVQDFTCFLQRYAAGDSYANCDNSTVAPVLNVQDFTCFLQSYAAGCP